MPASPVTGRYRGLALEISVPIKANKLREFLQYLQSEFGKLGGWRSNGGYGTDGAFVEQLDVSIDAGGKRVPTSWTFKWNPDGSLAPVEILAADEEAVDWEDAAHAIIQDALAATINAQKENFIRRDQFAYIGPNLDGEYWVSGWRVAPALPTDDADFLSERIVYLDHQVKAVDHSQSIGVGTVKADRIVTLLSLFMNFGLYRIPMEKRWVYTGRSESRRFQLGYRSPLPYPTSMPKKGSECPLGRPISIGRRDFRSSLIKDGKLHLPDDVRRLFRAFHRLNPIAQEVFFGAAALYRIALVAGRDLPTVRLSYQVAAVEALIEGSEHRQRLFVELVQKYNPGTTTEFLEYLYGNVRSAHFHAGQFPLGEYEPLEVGLFTGPVYLNRTALLMSAATLLQPVLIDWLLEHTQT